MATSPAPAATSSPVAADARPAEARADVALDEVRRTVMELLRADKRALKRAADFPLIFRVPVAVDGKSARFGGLFAPDARDGRPEDGVQDGKSRWGARLRRPRAETGRRFPGLAAKGRWGARPLTRLYVETHVRRQLEAVRTCLRLELLGTTAADDRKCIEELDDELARLVPPLLQWGRLRALVARVPALSAAVPAVWALSLVPTDDLAVGSGKDALLLLAATVVGVWVVVVVPSVRLGFRVKRAIFNSGEDIARPFRRDKGKIEWETLTGSPNVYEAENDAFKALGRRKPREHPLDVLLSFAPYVGFAVLALVIVGIVDAARTGFEGYEPVNPLGYLVVLAIIYVPFRLAGNARLNTAERRH